MVEISGGSGSGSGSGSKNDEWVYGLDGLEWLGDGSNGESNGLVRKAKSLRKDRLASLRKQATRLELNCT